MKHNRKLLKHDWNKLTHKYLTWGGNLKDFAKKHKVGYEYCWKKADELGWYDKRDKVREKALLKAQETLPDKLGEQWAIDSVANRDLAKLIAKKVAKGEGLTANEVKAYASALNDVAKHYSFIQGGPTERTETKNLNAHIDIVDWLANGLPEG